jgi:hypothetical protein
LGPKSILKREKMFFAVQWERAPKEEECSEEQGCQIFISTKYQNGEKCTKLIQNVPNGYKISLISIKYS